MVDNISVRAQRMATATPASRNRYADFLRALAILAVVFGHWLMAAVWVDESGFHTANVLGRIEATQWLTWGLQVMPIFFFVGGFSNAVAWDRRREPYASWLAARARRLALPTVPLLLLWATIGFFGPALGLETSLLRSGSQVALVPLWFLAVYVLMVAATPLTTRLWETAGARGLPGWQQRRSPRTSFALPRRAASASQTMPLSGLPSISSVTAGGAGSSRRGERARRWPCWVARSSSQ